MHLCNYSEVSPFLSILTFSFNVWLIYCSRQTRTIL
nr:MAG TPA: hypothetical protein [Caudoviricetes sp.]